jgi:hypothetical protein
VEEEEYHILWCEKQILLVRIKERDRMSEIAESHMKARPK